MTDRPAPSDPRAHRPDGTFAPGNAGGPGQPPKLRARQALYQRLAYEVVSEEEWRAIIIKAKVDALTGEDGHTRAIARAFLRDTLIGKPAQSLRFDDDESIIDEFADVPTDELRLIAAQGSADAGAGASAH